MKATVHHCDTVFKDVSVYWKEDVDIPDDDMLSALQKLVSGYIELYVHCDGKDWIVNEEGISHGLPLNPWAASQGIMLFGTIVVLQGKLP